MTRKLLVWSGTASRIMWNKRTRLSMLCFTSQYREKKAVNKQLVQDLIDMVIPVAGLNIIGFDEGIVGIAG